MDCSLPGFSIHGIFQSRILEWVAISFSRGSSQPRDGTWVSLIVGRHFSVWATREVKHFYRDPKAPDNTLPCLFSCLLSLTRSCGCFLGSVQCRNLAGPALASEPLHWPCRLPAVPPPDFGVTCALFYQLFAHKCHILRGTFLCYPSVKLQPTPRSLVPFCCIIFFLST